jgi:putative SOS response-associated peptidase YedK
MCGRYKRPGKQKIAEAFAVSEGLEAFDLDPDDNACPQSFQPVIRLSENGERQIEMMRWAFKLPDKLLFNARSEGIEKARFWANSFQKRRCIVPASAIQGSQDLPDGKKGDKYEFDIPAREIFGMAGVWKLWKHPKTDEWESTFAVLTGEPNEVMQPIHDRLTTVLEPRDYAEHLAFSERPPIHLLRILPSNELRATRLEKPVRKSRSKSKEDHQVCLFGSDG